MGEENGGYWYARELMKWLGYETYSAFQKAIGRSISTCSTLEFSIGDHFTPVQRVRFLLRQGAAEDPRGDSQEQGRIGNHGSSKHP